jgi:predicted O-methyltransferase YrrM
LRRLALERPLAGDDGLTPLAPTVRISIPSRSERKRTHVSLVAGDPLALSAATLPGGDGPPSLETLGRLYETSPYTGFDPESHPDDMQGWNSQDNVFRDLITAVQPHRIVEIGVWKGAASIHMAKIAKELGLRCEVLCIDTWLGSPEHFLADREGERYKSLRLHNGYPQLYYNTFLANVVRHGVADHVVPLPTTSESAVVMLQKLGLEADIIHIDAAHEYEPALRDFRAYWSLLSERGVLLGDDYLAKSSVTRAADDFAREVERPLCGLFPKCVIAKSPEIRFKVETAPHRGHDPCGSDAGLGSCGRA